MLKTLAWAPITLFYMTKRVHNVREMKHELSESGGSIREVEFDNPVHRSCDG